MQGVHQHGPRTATSSILCPFRMTIWTQHWKHGNNTFGTFGQSWSPKVVEKVPLYHAHLAVAAVLNISNENKGIQCIQATASSACSWVHPPCQTHLSPCLCWNPSLCKVVGCCWYRTIVPGYDECNCTEYNIYRYAPKCNSEKLKNKPVAWHACHANSASRPFLIYYCSCFNTTLLSYMFIRTTARMISNYPVDPVELDRKRWVHTGTYTCARRVWSSENTLFWQAHPSIQQ